EIAPLAFSHTVEDDRDSTRPARAAQSAARPCPEPALGLACPHTGPVRAAGPVPLGRDTTQPCPAAVGGGAGTPGRRRGGHIVPGSSQRRRCRSRSVPARRRHVVSSYASGGEVPHRVLLCRVR